MEPKNSLQRLTKTKNKIRRAFLSSNKEIYCSILFLPRILSKIYGKVRPEILSVAMEKMLV